MTPIEEPDLRYVVLLDQVYPFNNTQGLRLALLFQSLLQMNVPHRHCVFFSFAPDGPSGLGSRQNHVHLSGAYDPRATTHRTHIQNSRPQLKPVFLVFITLHGSPWSQRGATGLVKSFDHESLETMGSMTSTLR